MICIYVYIYIHTHTHTSENSEITKTKNVFSVFCHNSAPSRRIGMRSSGNSSYKSPGAVYTLQDLQKRPETLKTSNFKIRKN